MDEMVGWHHRFNGQDFDKLWDIVKDRDACCSPYGHKESDMIE